MRSEVAESAYRQWYRSKMKLGEDIFEAVTIRKPE